MFCCFRELADFKPSYYSLDFAGTSPQHKARHSSSEGFVWNRSPSSHKPHRARKDTLILECRKLEASIRALSSGSLDLMQKNDADLRLELGCGKGSHSCETFDRFTQPDSNMMVVNDEDDNAFLESEDSKVVFECSPNGVQANLDWNIGEIDDDFEEEILGAKGVSDSGYSDNAVEETEMMFVGPLTDTDTRNERFNRQRPKSRHINPFLKQNSLDPYTFNTVLAGCSASEESSSIEVVFPHTEDFPDQLSVDFKPMQQPKQTEISFFKSVKAKLKEIFDSSKTDSQNSQSQNSSIMSNGPSLHSLTSITSKTPPVKALLTRGGSKPELTAEQLRLAEQLNFQVREFPLSSCSHVISPDQEVEPFVIDRQMDKKEMKSQTLTENYSEKYRSHNRNLTAECKGMSEMWQEGISDEWESREDHGICELIYDGYIKIDPRQMAGDEDGFLSKDCCALGLSQASYDDRGIGAETVDLRKTFPNLTSHKENNLITQTCDSGVDSAINKSVCNTLQNDAQIDKSTNVGVNDNDTVFESANGGSPKHGSNTKVEVPDGSAKGSGERLSRYYHVFREGELQTLISDHIPELRVIKCFYDHANWCVIAEKLAS